MEPLLTLDLSDSPAKLRVISYEENTLKVWSESSVELTFQSELSITDPLPEENSTSSSDDSAPSREEAVNLAPDASQYFVSQLTSAIEKLDPIWSSSALLVAPLSYHSLNLELPFKDDKSIVKVLALEAQDRLPFDVDEFFLEHKVLGIRPDNQFDVHVALTRKEEMNTLLTNCQRAGLDPMAISTVASLLEGQVLANPNAFSINSVFLSFHGENGYLAFRVAGEFKSDRALKIKGRSPTQIISEIQRSIGAVQARYSIAFEELWLDWAEDSSRNLNINLDVFKTDLIENINIPLKVIDKEVSTSPAHLTDWFASLCADGKASKLFVNFRSGQFSQTLRWGELWRMTSSTLPYLLMLILFSIGILAATYINRESEIDSLQDAIVSKVQPLLGDTKLVPGQIVKAIQSANDTIEKQLKDLGSPSKYSPLDVLSEVTKDFSSIKDVTINSVNIRGTQLIVVGSSSNYENVDAIEKVLQAKRTLYCRPSKQVSGTTSRQFTFTITLCD